MPHYSISTLLRQTPKTALRAYFDRQGVLADLDLAGLKRTQTDAIVAAIDALDDRGRARVDADFRDVFTLADKGGTLILTDQLQALGLPLGDTLCAMENHYHRAMWLFLNPRHGGVDVFQQCLSIAGMNDLSFARAKRRRNLPRLVPHHDDATLEAMAAGLRQVYRKQGRGRYCTAEHYFRPNPDRHCFFAYPEDYSTSELQYEDGALARRTRRSVFNVVYIYRPDEGLLEISAPGGKKDIELVQEVFCRTALGLDGIPPESDRDCWRLNGLKRLDFAFPTDPADRIASVEVVSLRLHPMGNPRRRITVEQDPASGEPLFTWLNRIVDTAQVPLELLDVSQARVRVVWEPEDDKKPVARTFTLGVPDSTTLKDDPLHLVIKRYLKAWNIAP